MLYTVVIVTADATEGWTIGVERHLERITDGEHDSHHGSCLEQGLEPLRHGYDACMNTGGLLSESQHAAVKVIAQRIGLGLGCLIGKEGLILGQLGGHGLLTEEGAEYLLFLERRLARPVALQ